MIDGQKKAWKIALLPIATKFGKQQVKRISQFHGKFQPIFGYGHDIAIFWTPCFYGGRTGRVGRWGSHAPLGYIFLTYIFVILRRSRKRISMFPSQNIVPRPHFGDLKAAILDFWLKSIMDNNF